MPDSQGEQKKNFTPWSNLQIFIEITLNLITWAADMGNDLFGHFQELISENNGIPKC